MRICIREDKFTRCAFPEPISFAYHHQSDLASTLTIKLESRPASTNLHINDDHPRRITPYSSPPHALVKIPSSSYEIHTMALEKLARRDATPEVTCGIFLFIHFSVWRSLTAGFQSCKLTFVNVKFTGKDALQTLDSLMAQLLTFGASFVSAIMFYQYLNKNDDGCLRVSSRLTGIV